MPEFQMPLGESGNRFRALSLFEQGYVEAMFFTECTPDNEEMEHCTFDDLSEEARDQIHADCEEFVKFIPEELSLVQAGHDFWFTRNHHGAGFWDRGLGELGDKLTGLAHAAGERDLYRGDDGKLYFG